MYFSKSRLRGVVSTRPSTLFFKLRAAAVQQFSASARLSASRGAMFKKAVNNHTGPPKPPLQSNASRANTISFSASQSTASIAGAKRKLDMTNSGQSDLGSLHSAVYFDADDFDSDSDLDFEIQHPLPRSQNSMSTSTNSGAGSTIGPTTSTDASKTNLLLARTGNGQDLDQDDIKYPDLPQPDDRHQESTAPQSSAPIPWSSSPPSHHLPPPLPPPQKRRTIPWQTSESNTDTKNPVTPAAQKTTSKKADMPWNKTASAVKDEQKELRKISKKKSASVDDNQKRKPRERVASLFLSDEQKGVLDAVVEKGKSIFFTGSAGTGKSVLMREIIKQLRNKYRREPDRIAVTASTGLAACNIEGVTLHSFAGIGLGKEPATELVKKVRKNQKARNRWQRTKVLIVDEVSMVDGDLFDKLEEIARRIRNNGRPFGGIQLVVTGDFFQLPPVPENSTREAKFAFDAATWCTSIQHTILLTHVFRQKDPAFAEMLNEMRLGKISPKTIEAFRALSRPLDFHDSLEATELFPTRAEVENANAQRMRKLSGDVMTFNAVDSGSIQDPQMRERLLANCMAPPTIHLKKGAQVMLIKNMEDTLVNGSVGRVVAFMDESTFDYYRTNEDDFTGDGKEGSDDESTARKKIRALAHGKEGGVTTGRRWPLVCFVQADGTERHLLCQPESWKIELPNGEIQAMRTQVPLILAWALSIHKAQGQTLPRVKVDLGKVFEKGQAYVALSRATSQAGLQVSRFDPKKVMVHSKVVTFYSNLTSINTVMKDDGANKKQKINDNEPSNLFGKFMSV